MDLNYVLDSNPNWLSQLEREGYDLDALLCLCDELFTLADDLSLSPCEVGEFFLRLKTARDITNGKEAKPLLVLYENSRGVASRLVFEERISGRNFLFRLIPVLGRGDEVYYKCETCPGSVSVVKTEARGHIEERHLR